MTDTKGYHDESSKDEEEPPYQIITVPDPVLRLRAAPVQRFDQKLRLLAQDMLRTMTAAHGVGLAAPQIGVSQRLFVMRIRADDKRLPAGHPLAGHALVVINPKIVQQSDEQSEGMEACLSIPGYAGLVDRAERIVVQARNQWGKPVRYAVDGFVARVMQHEIDHLDGVLYVDRLTSEEKLLGAGGAAESLPHQIDEPRSS